MADGYYRARSKAKTRSSNEAANVTAPTKVIINKKFFGDPSLWADQPLSNMYNNSQYSAQGYQNNYTQYPQNYNSNYGYDGYNQGQYISTTVQPVPPGEEYPQNNWAPVGGYHGGTNVAQTSTYETKNEDEGVAQERKAQNAQLIKQREDYVRKARVLRRELELLRNQKHEIMSENSSQRDMELILKENVKLQDEIQTKMKAIHNVIEMLSSIIKDGKKISDLEAQLDESPKTTQKNHKTDNDSSVRYNYMHYDPELHWCRMCDEFPKTAKDFLLHLQGDKHRNNIQENDVGDNTPWHKLAPEPELPYHEGAQKKRIPIRGLQFFISAPAWYCKLCDTWIGDLHCASHHLKSQAHFQNYANFVEQNPHWEIEWLKDREKAMARNERRGNSSDSDQVSEKRKKRHKNKRSSMDSSSKDKKKKKRSKKRRKHSSDTSSSSSSSDSSSDDDEPNDKSKSIRVVMRNMKVQSIMNEDLSGKWEMLERLVDEHKKKEEMKKEEMHKKESQKKEPDDKLINQWMTVSEPQDKEKALLDNLKDRMKQKQELERAKFAEMEKKQREKEKEEKEIRERKEREEREAKERYEREKREREREEYERIRDKERNQVKFKATRDRENYRKRKTPSPSPERTKQSPTVEEREPSVSRERKDSQSSNTENGQNEEQRSRSASEEKKTEPEKKPAAKRLPFIGRMPLFKNKKVEERSERKEIKKEEYDIPRKSRFQPGNLAKAFLPSPDVVCYPKLSCIPELTIPPPPVVSQPDPPDPPKISEDQLPKAPPAPKIGPNDDDEKPKRRRDREQEEIEEMYGDPSQFLESSNMMMGQYYAQGMDYSMMYSQMYEYQQEQPPQPPPPPDDVPLSHTMPLQPPPLPPSDPSEDLAMLGISADDMAAQSF